MFGKKKLMKNGATANAAVMAADMSGMSDSHGAHKWHLDLSVQFDDGSTENVKCSAYETNIGMGFGPGDIVPVRYDTNDRTKVEVDTDAMKAKRLADLEEGRAGLARMAQERLAKGETDSL